MQSYLALSIIKLADIQFLFAIFQFSFIDQFAFLFIFLHPSYVGIVALLSTASCSSRHTDALSGVPWSQNYNSTLCLPGFCMASKNLEVVLSGLLWR